ncbi:MAG: DUF4263 domain-containing protein [Thermoplasmatota archaeon]
MISMEDKGSSNIESHIPPIAFLGFCERYSFDRTGHPIDWKHNVIGLRNLVPLYVYPASLSPFNLAFALYDPINIRDIDVKIVGPDQWVSIKVNGEEISTKEPTEKQIPQEDRSSLKTSISPVDEKPSWHFAVINIEKYLKIIKTPGRYDVVYINGEDEIPLGFFDFIYLKTPPLTPDRIEAIKSNPLASKWIWMVLQCNKCEDVIEIYTGLEKNEKFESERNWIWYQNVPDEFVCKCDDTKINLSFVKENLHSLLGQTKWYITPDDHERLYEDQYLRSIQKKFFQLIKKDPPEEEIQVFIKNNPIFLNQFSPSRIFPKAPIRSKYNTDFAILSENGELILIELEKASTKLLKRDGGMHSEMNHAFDQIRSWLAEFDEERSATIKDVGLHPDEVNAIHGIAILGRNEGYEKEQLRNLKKQDWGRITFLTYDDLVNNMGSLIRYLESM